MLNPLWMRLFLDQLRNAPAPGLTLRVWCVVLTALQFGKREIAVNTTELAYLAHTTRAEVSRAMTFLQGLKMVERVKPGVYAINPHVCWAGSLLEREATVRDYQAPALEVEEVQ